MISKPSRLKFDGVAFLQGSELEKSPMFTPVGSPSAVDRDDKIETATPPALKLGVAALGSSSTTAPVKRQPLAPMLRQPQITAAAAAPQDAAAEALLALLAASVPAAQTEPPRIRNLCNRHESVRQARMAHHRLRISLGISLGVQLRS